MVKGKTVSCAHLWGLTVLKALESFLLVFLKLVCLRVLLLFSYKYMRVTNIYVNTTQMLTFIMLWTGSPLLIVSPSFPPFIPVLCVVKKKGNHPHFCSLMDVCMNNCIIFFAFCCLFTVIFFCTINHLFSLYGLRCVLIFVFYLQRLLYHCLRVWMLKMSKCAANTKSMAQTRDCKNKPVS